MVQIKANIFLLGFSEIPLIKAMNFEPSELLKFEQCVKVIKYKKKESILSVAEEETHFRIVKSGVARQFYKHNGYEITTQFSSDNDILCSYTSYLSRSASIYAIQAIESTTIYSFSRNDLDFLMSKGPKFIEFSKQISAAISIKMELREMEFLNYDALARFQHFYDTRKELMLSLPQTFIASYLNIKPETLSSLKKKLFTKN